MGKILRPVLLLLPLTMGCYNPAKIVITNGLESENIEYIYISSDSEEEWGINSLPNWEVLPPGESLEIAVLPDTYDLQVVDQNGHTYTKWDMEVKDDDLIWEVVPADID